MCIQYEPVQHILQWSDETEAAATPPADRSILLRMFKRHDFRGPAFLLGGRDSQFTYVGLFDTHKCGSLWLVPSKAPNPLLCTRGACLLLT